MFGIIAFGDKQYKIVPSEGCVFERIEGEEGKDVVLSGLVLVANDSDVVLDKKELAKYKVKGTILKQFREDKVIAYKKKRRHGYERKRGHRQYKTLVLIKSIEAQG
jgi:large subunit ribosomal protein L21